MYTRNTELYIIIHNSDKSSAVAEMGDRFATRRDPKSRRCCTPFHRGGAGLVPI